MPPLEVGLSHFTSRNPAVSPFGDAEAERDEGGLQGGLEGQRPAERDRAGNCSPLATRTGRSGDWTGSPLGHQPCSPTHTAVCRLPGATGGGCQLREQAGDGWVQSSCLCCWTSATGSLRRELSGTLENKGLFLSGWKPTLITKRWVQENLEVPGERYPSPRPPCDSDLHADSRLCTQRAAL